MRFYVFAGLGFKETAAAQGISGRAVRREWALALAWLHREFSSYCPVINDQFDGSPHSKPSLKTTGPVQIACRDSTTS